MPSTTLVHSLPRRLARSSCRKVLSFDLQQKKSKLPGIRRSLWILSSNFTGSLNLTVADSRLHVFPAMFPHYQQVVSASAVSAKASTCAFSVSNADWPLSLNASPHWQPLSAVNRRETARQEGLSVSAATNDANLCAVRPQECGLKNRSRRKEYAHGDRTLPKTGNCFCYANYFGNRSITLQKPDLTHESGYV